ncbi:CoA pyrophosphatase [Promethearchaeum syntrophicum]|uniref:CoA pyrophosphatase n=1 Tax=Promethearchaeum syntrophicum TaxID=2594042 RepID=A0A5B9DF03_9ARCH|nr:CoA pyrophosphatase [Candidatus Prometheoarchaeum syntrophicum]QEE17601.1 putative NUDIX hydrolase [Candidatus Prometheoarchaeum syntrophicum]
MIQIKNSKLNYIYNPHEIESLLANFIPYHYETQDLRNSAVLIPILPIHTSSSKSPSYQIIMTGRSPKLKHHTGEMSFPGGKFDPAQDNCLKDTALRETYEEIGVTPENIRIIGNLDDLPTLTGWTIRVFIGLLEIPPDFRFSINQEEVSALVKIPIEYIARNNLFYKIPFPKDHNFSMLCFDYNDPELEQNFKIWGASAHMLQEFLKKIYNIVVISPEYKRPTLKECLDAVRR